MPIYQDCHKQFNIIQEDKELYPALSESHPVPSSITQHHFVIKVVLDGAG